MMTFKERVSQWARMCFGDEAVENKRERCNRFIEEALELCQALDMPKEDALALVEYVYGRPKGEAHQEMGGVMLTLALLSKVSDVNMNLAGEDELRRVWSKIEIIRRKQANKPNGALPE